MTPIRFVTRSIIALALLMFAVGIVAAQPKADAPQTPEIFVLFVSAFDGEHVKKEDFGGFSTRERCAEAAEVVMRFLRPRMQTLAWGCMALDVSAEYVATVKRFEAAKDAGKPPGGEEPAKDVRRAPEA